MVKERFLERCGLGLTIDDVGVGVVEISVVGMKRARTKNNKSIIVVAFDEN